MVVYLGGERKGKETKGDEMGEEGREGREGREGQERRSGSEENEPLDFVDGGDLKIKGRRRRESKKNYK